MTSKFYILTTSFRSHVLDVSSLPVGVSYWRGQLELGVGGLLHWQHTLAMDKKVRVSAVKRIFPTSHIELSRSDAVYEYCWKDDTCIEGTRFEHGVRPFRAAAKVDYEHCYELARTGRVDEIPPAVLFRCYSNIRRIEKDFMCAQAFERTVHVFWGETGRGKSRFAWDRAGIQAYPKDPNTKFWDGYNPAVHRAVVMDEFRGLINVSNLLRWFDRYPVCVEVKGGACVFSAREIYITSNLHPDEWYPQLDEATRLALRRRFTEIVEFGSGDKFSYEGGFQSETETLRSIIGEEGSSEGAEATERSQRSFASVVSGTFPFSESHTT